MTYDKDLKKWIGKQSFVLMPVVQRFRQKIVQDGFKPHLPGIVEEIKRLWTKHQQLPFIVLSRMPDGVDYWEPNYGDKGYSTVATIALALRRLARQGLKEALFITETWDKDDDGNRSGRETLMIKWECPWDCYWHSFDVRAGRNRKYLSLRAEGAECLTYNPILDPWNKNEELFDYFSVPTEQREEFDKELKQIETDIWSEAVN